MMSEWNHFEGLPVLFSSEKKIPGSWQYALRRHPLASSLGVDDHVTLVYHYDELV